MCVTRTHDSLFLFFSLRHGMLERFSRNENEAKDRGIKMLNPRQSRYSREDMMIFQSINSRLWISIFVQDPRVFTVIGAICDTFLAMERKRVVETRAHN